MPATLAGGATDGPPAQCRRTARRGRLHRHFPHRRSRHCHRLCPLPALLRPEQRESVVLAGTPAAAGAARASVARVATASAGSRHDDALRQVERRALNWRRRAEWMHRLAGRHCPGCRRSHRRHPRHPALRSNRCGSPNSSDTSRHRPHLRHRHRCPPRRLLRCHQSSVSRPRRRTCRRSAEKPVRASRTRRRFRTRRARRRRVRGLCKRPRCHPVEPPTPPITLPLAYCRWW